MVIDTHDGRPGFYFINGGRRGVDCHLTACPKNKHSDDVER